jgi:hypothetical protein
VTCWYLIGEHFESSEARCASNFSGYRIQYEVRNISRSRVAVPTARTQGCDVLEKFNGSSPEEKKRQQYQAENIVSSDVLIGRSIWEYLLRRCEEALRAKLPLSTAKARRQSTVDGQHEDKSTGRAAD